MRVDLANRADMDDRCIVWSHLSLRNVVLEGTLCAAE